ncbi:MAG: hypothetical protein FWG07_09295 [Treponema sp.]|nr:hypothetical protein [Treponema sp.]
MIVKCPYCGHEYGGTGASGGVTAFFERLDALDQQLFEAEAAKEAKGGLVRTLFAETAKQIAGTSAGDKRKLEMIQNFPIPNSGEDILEFVILASSRITPVPGLFSGTSMTEIRDAEKYNDAWNAKIKQAYAKAQVIFASDPQELRRIDQILKAAGTSGTVKSARSKHLLLAAAGVAVAVIVLVLAFIFDW